MVRTFERADASSVPARIGKSRTRVVRPSDNTAELQYSHTGSD
jgi:hypothetical protein